MIYVYIISMEKTQQDIDYNAILSKLEDEDMNRMFDLVEDERLEKVDNLEDFEEMDEILEYNLNEE